MVTARGANVSAAGRRSAPACDGAASLHVPTLKVQVSGNRPRTSPGVATAQAAVTGAPPQLGRVLSAVYVSPARTARPAGVSEETLVPV
jgi:hypothetical protein